MTVRRLLLDRPRHANALDVATVERLHDELDAAERDRVDVVVLAARGRAFCGGLDLGTLEDETDASLLWRLVRIQLLLERLQEASALTVALVDGPAIGAGADLALACDVRLASPAASLRFPGPGFGAVLGTQRLAQLTSPAWALEAATTRRRIDVAEAETRGLWRVLPHRPALDDAVAALAVQPATLPAGTVPRLRAAAGGTPSSSALGDLVRSLAHPGLRDRVTTYRRVSA